MMTLSEAQAELTKILNSLNPDSSAAELDAQSDALLALQQNLPSGREFDVVSQTIQSFLPKLTGRISQMVLADLQSRHSHMLESTNLIAHVGAQANQDSRTISFEQPKLVLTTLSTAVSQLRELSTAAQGNDVQKVGTKAEALITLVESTLKSVKTA